MNLLKFNRLPQYAQEEIQALQAQIAQLRRLPRFCIADPTAYGLKFQFESGGIWFEVPTQAQALRAVLADGKYIDITLTATHLVLTPCEHSQPAKRWELELVKEVTK